MKIAYITIKDKNVQGDYLEIMALRSFRKVLGENCIDYPKKKTLYGDWSEVTKDNLHGKGFTIFTPELQEIKSRDISNVDAVVYGFVKKPNYVNDIYPEIDALNKPTFYIDGHDDADVMVTPCFKHEVHGHPEGEVFPMNLAIPSEKIRDIDLSIKRQLIQKTAPPYSRFGPQVLGIPGRQLYIYDNEEDYYEDMSQSWFGLSCRKGSWDALRNYEIIAAGSLLLFRDLDQKPRFASPLNIPGVSYSTPQQLEGIVNSLLVDGKPTDQYIHILNQQRQWLLDNATEKAVGEYMVKIIEEKLKQKGKELL
jgi:hypothetical protein